MKLSQMFPSKYAKAADIVRPLQLTINRVAFEAMPDGNQKPVIHFDGFQKGIVCNRTNAKTVALLAKSEETNDWPGTKVEIFTELVGFRGEVVQAIRFRAPGERAAAVEPEDEPASMEEELDDEIPF